MPDDEVSGAIHTVLAHPTDPDILYAGAVNGGIWRTTNATATRPSWQSLTDALPSLSIGALEMEPGDPSVLLAGTGSFSSFGGAGGLAGLLYLSRDAGTTWRVIDNLPSAGNRIRGLAIRGQRLLAASDFGGLSLSTNDGATWQVISDRLGSGLPSGFITDFLGDPTNLQRFYITISGAGLFRSEDGGETWINVSQNDPGAGGLDEAMQQFPSNAEMAVGRDGRLYVALVNFEVSYVGFTTDRGASWVRMDLPLFPDAGLHPGGQGFIHFSIGVDPIASNIVYLGGDRQPLPSFFGANNFDGRLVRGDADVAPTGTIPSPQWEHLTHSNAIPEVPGGGTASHSAPHADSREMAFDANGDMIEVNDGGVVRRTRPRDNTGDWFSINGDIQIAEIHDVAFDANSLVAIAGTQDTGTPMQTAPGSLTWDEFSQGDGGDVQVDSTSLPGFSIRYTSFQFLGAFTRTTFDANNVEVNREFPTLNVVSGDPFPFGQFVTPVELNRRDPRRLVIAFGNAIYESFDRGDNIASLEAGGGAQSMVYGHPGNADVLYAVQFGQVLVRLAAGAPLAPTATPVPDFSAQDVVLDPADFRRAFVAGFGRVFVTTDAGASWQEITGNLGVFDPGELRSVELIPSSTHNLLVVGSDRGVFASASDALGTWQRVGSGLPNAPVFDMQFARRQNRLVVGTLGRGSFSILGLAEEDGNQPPIARCRSVVVDAGNSCVADVPASAIDAGSFDPDGDAVSCTLEPAGPFGVGSTTVTLTCRDAEGATDSCTASVTVGVGNNPRCCPRGTRVIVGNSGPNVLRGTDGRDCILGLGGDDTIDARGHNDIVSGGSGRDTIAAGFGNDIVTGGSGDDVIDSGPGDDRVGGGSGRDTIAGSTGDDIIDGGPDDDICTAAPGEDEIFACEAGDPPASLVTRRGLQNGPRVASTPCRSDADCGPSGLCLVLGGAEHGRCVPRRAGCHGSGCGCLPEHVCRAPMACIERGGAAVCVAPPSSSNLESRAGAARR